MTEPKNDKGFKVVDRRLFTEQGELRNDAVEQERRDEQAAAKRATERSYPQAAPVLISDDSG